MRTRRTLLATGLVALLAIAGVTAAIANDPPPRIAFLANGIVPADALAAGPIAGQLGAPIFTTGPDALVDSTATALDAYNPELVIVMGGPVAISDAVLAQVSAATGLGVVAPNPPPTSGIVRAAGEDRFETAAAAAALLAAYDPAYLPTDMKAVDSDLLDGKDSTAFQPAGDYLGRTQKAADADKLDGLDSADLEMPFAVIEDNGVLIASVLASRGLEALSHTEGTGLYVLTFDRDVSNCAWSATQGNRNNAVWSDGFGRTIYAHSRSDPTQVQVQLKDQNFSDAERSFSLVITC